MEATASALAPGGGGLGLTQRPVFRQGYGPDQLGQAYRPAGQEGGDSGGGGHGGNRGLNSLVIYQSFWRTFEGFVGLLWLKV